MGLFHHDDDQDHYGRAYDEQGNERDDPSFGQELLAGAGAAFATKKYEDHVGKNGNPPSHTHAKEFVAGIAGFAVDRLAQKHHIKSEDRDRYREEAQRRAADSVNEGNYNNYSDRQDNNWDNNARQSYDQYGGGQYGGNQYGGNQYGGDSGYGQGGGRW